MRVLLLFLGTLTLGLTSCVPQWEMAQVQELLSAPRSLPAPRKPPGARMVEKSERDGNYRRTTTGFVLDRNPLTVFYVPAGDGALLYLSPPSELERQISDYSCALTDRDPEDVVATWGFRSDAEVVTLSGLGGVTPLPRFGRYQPSPLRPDDLPAAAWLVCSRIVDARISGTAYFDSSNSTRWAYFYPVRLESREPGTIEIAERVVEPNDIKLRLRLHPPPTSNAARLDLLVFEPPRGRSGDKTVLVGAYLYHGLERERTGSRYDVGLFGGADGGFYATLLGLTDGPFEFEVYARLSACETEADLSRLSALNPPPNTRCDLNTSVQTFYTHEQFLRSYGIEPPRRFTMQIVSPDGWESEVFTVRVGE